MNRPRAGVAAVAFLLALPVSAQPPQAPKPSFRSGVDLLRVHATAVDDRGQPVRDLQPSDFSVRIDGEDRPLRFAQFYGPSGEVAVTAGAEPPAPSFALNTTSGPGRAVVFVVDLVSIKQGYEKLILDAAARLVDGLGPNDAVGLMPIPGAGVDLTRDRERVSSALRTLRGVADVPLITHYFTLSEAVAFEQLNRRVIGETIERECCRTCTSCPDELKTETRELLTQARAHARSVVTSLTNLADALRPLDAPRTIVLLSAGLPFEQDSLGLFTDLQRALTRAGIMIFSVQVSQPDSDASNVKRPGTGTLQSSDLTAGLANVATMAGGAMFTGVGTAKGVFERLRTEVVYSYELGIEGRPGDLDGKTHDVKVTVSRPGVSVRSRTKIMPVERTGDPATRLGRLLGQPIDVTDLPVAATAYSVRGEDAATLKVIVAAELGGSVTLTPPIQYAVTINREGKAVFQTNDVAVAGADGARVLTAAQLAPGRYRLRLAGIDGVGRGGTVELPITVALRAAGTLQASDVILGIGQSFTPVVRVREGQSLSALIELYSADPAQFAAATVDYELRKAGTAAVITTSPATLRTTALERRQVADGTIGTVGLTPGDYSVSAVIALSGTPVGRVSRNVLIEQ